MPETSLFLAIRVGDTELSSISGETAELVQDPSILALQSHSTFALAMQEIKMLRRCNVETFQQVATGSLKRFRRQNPGHFASPALPHERANQNSRRMPAGCLVPKAVFQRVKHVRMKRQMAESTGGPADFTRKCCKGVSESSQIGLSSSDLWTNHDLRM
jgi:hypothetical protein